MNLHFRSMTVQRRNLGVREGEGEGIKDGPTEGSVEEGTLSLSVGGDGIGVGVTAGTTSRRRQPSRRIGHRRFSLTCTHNM